MENSFKISNGVKILFLVPYPTEGASNRYRVEQYLPYLKAENITYTLRPFMSSDYYRIFYKKGKVLLKILYFLKSTYKRMLDILLVFKHDIIFIHIEAFPIGPPIIEYFASIIVRKPIIFDFEDAIYLPRKGLGNIFKNPRKFFKIIKMSRHIIVCNNYLKEFLSPYNSNITVIPTSIDTERFQVDIHRDYRKEKVVIGWIGSHTTLPLLLELENIFRELGRSHKFILKIVGGGTVVNIDGVEVINEEWSLEREVENFRSIDIGVYPLPDNEWAKAKTPFKTIQYMSVGIPAVTSCVAGNKDIIQDGQNGFLCLNEADWVYKLSLLIEDADLRYKMGNAGRKTVEERFSINISAPKYIGIIKKQANV